MALLTINTLHSVSRRKSIGIDSQSTREEEDMRRFLLPRPHSSPVVWCLLMLLSTSSSSAGAALFVDAVSIEFSFYDPVYYPI